MVLFIRKLREILDGSEECRGKYELVPISGEENQISDVLLRILNDEHLQMDERAGAE